MYTKVPLFNLDVEGDVIEKVGWIEQRIWIGIDPFLLGGILFGEAHSEVKGLKKGSVL